MEAISPKYAYILDLKGIFLKQSYMRYFSIVSVYSGRYASSSEKQTGSYAVYC